MKHQVERTTHTWIMNLIVVLLRNEVLDAGVFFMNISVRERSLWDSQQSEDCFWELPLGHPYYPKGMHFE